MRFNINEKSSKLQNPLGNKNKDLGDSETVTPAESANHPHNNFKHADPAAILNENMSLGASTPASPTSLGTSHNE